MAARKSATVASAPAPLETGGVATSIRGVSKRELVVFRKRLQAELTELNGQLAELEEATNTGLDGSGEVVFDEEWADSGSFTFERERDLSLSNNVKDLIDKVERALFRMDEGTYGHCEICGNQIEPERLDALPYTTLCLADARRRIRPR